MQNWQKKMRVKPVLAVMAGEGEGLAQDTGEKARQKAQNYQIEAQKYYGQSAEIKTRKNPFGTANTIFSGLNDINTSLRKNSAVKRGPNYF